MEGFCNVYITIVILGVANSVAGSSLATVCDPYVGSTGIRDAMAAPASCHAMVATPGGEQNSERRLLYVIRWECGETGGLPHCHGLIGGLGDSKNWLSSCHVARADWRQGVSQVRLFNPARERGVGRIFLRVDSRQHGWRGQIVTNWRNLVGLVRTASTSQDVHGSRCN